MISLVSTSWILGAVSMSAQPILEGVSSLGWFTNSLVVSLLVSLVLTLIVRVTTSKISIVPSGRQNFIESIVETLYDLVEGMVGKNLAARVFALMATIFVFILAANYSGLFPGVGTLGFGDSESGKWWDVEVHNPVIRPPSADLNMNLAIAVLFMIFWLVWSIQETGVKGFFSHIFGVKGKLEGNIFLRLFLIFIFAFVGCIEIISIAARPLSLSLRLYGNIFAGENLLHNMSDLGASFGLTGFWEFLAKVLLPLPFYFLELLVGLLQAGVFMILCTVYILLSTSHDEEHDHEADGHGHGHDH